MSVRISLTLDVSEIFLPRHMIFSLEGAAVVLTILERISGFDPSLELFLLSPHLRFIIVLICDLFVSRVDPLMSLKNLHADRTTICFEP